MTVQGLLGVAGLLCLLLLWWLGVHCSAADGLRRAFHPRQPWRAWRPVLRPELYEHVLVSLKRILVGLLLALLIGVPLGLLVGSYRHLEAATTPAFQFLRMISPLSWMPVVVMLMGVGDQPIYFLLAFAAVWPILLNTVAGVRQLDPRWLQLSRSLSATLGDPAQGDPARRARPCADRGAAGHRHSVDRAGAVRDARGQRRVGLLHPRYA
jgi:NitT/TauT family transport system permease protein